MAMNLGTDVRVPQMMNPNHFGDPLIFYVWLEVDIFVFLEKFLVNY